MNLKNYLHSRRGVAIDLAKAIGCTPVFLRNVANGHREVSEGMAVAIERETHGAVTVAELRPAFADSLKRAGYVKIDELEKKAA